VNAIAQLGEFARPYVIGVFQRSEFLLKAARKLAFR
jgi:hypothetical protein